MLNSLQIFFEYCGDVSGIAETVEAGRRYMTSRHDKINCEETRSILGRGRGVLNFIFDYGGIDFALRRFFV